MAMDVPAAVLEERRRLARDLHDGVIQELGYLRAQAWLVADSVLRERLAGSAERALAEARAALAGLAAEEAAGCAEAVARTAREAGERHGVPVRVHAADPRATAEQAAALVRITREAVANAARHGRPTFVRVDLGPGRLVVEDDGSGFDEASRGRSGFGLTSMRDRAEGLPGCLAVVSAPGSGTTVEVRW